MKPCRRGQCCLWEMLNRRRPKFDARAPAQRARSITLHTIQRAHAARRELLLDRPADGGDDRRVRHARGAVRARHARAGDGGDRAGDPRLGAGARPRPLGGAGAVPPRRSGHGRDGLVPDPADVPGAGGALRAADRGAGPARARRRRCDHRRRLRPRRPADAGQPDRRRGADRRAAVPDRRPRAAAGRWPGRPDRGHRRLARPALRHALARARTRSWSPTTSC